MDGQRDDGRTACSPFDELRAERSGPFQSSLSMAYGHNQE